MNYITERLLDIEKTAEGIVNNAEEEKKKIEREYQKKRDDFDAEIKAYTKNTIDEIHDNLKSDMEEKLTSQMDKNEREIAFLQKDYEENKEKYLKELLVKITEV